MSSKRYLEDLPGDAGPRKQARSQSFASPDPSVKQLLDKNRKDRAKKCDSVEKYQIIDELEEGTYGEVKLARNREAGQVVALKRLKQDYESDGISITTLREISLLQRLEHHSIVKLIEVVTGGGPNSIHLVMEYVAYDLRQVMAGMEEPFYQDEAKSLMLQLLTGLAYLHEHSIVHRDIKPGNLLLDRHCLKIADFGMARAMIDNDTMTPAMTTLWYRAPEILLGSKSYGVCVDMWSAGCVFYELFTLEKLFQGDTELAMLNKIFTLFGAAKDEESSDNLKSFSIKVEQKQTDLEAALGRVPSASGKDLFLRLLTCNHVSRIKSEEAITHEYFSEHPLPKHPDFLPEKKFVEIEEFAERIM